MTDHDSPIDDTIRRAIDDAESTIPDTDPDVLLAAARTVRDADTVRRRRTVTIVTGAAAAVVLVVAATVALTIRNGDDATQIAARGRGDADSLESTGGSATSGDAGSERPAVTIDPSADLLDGQTIAVVVAQGTFDPGTPVSAMQCTTGPPTHPTCDPRNRASLGPMPAPDGDLQASFTVFADLPAPAPYRLDPTTGSWGPDPVAGVGAPVSCASDGDTVVSSGADTGGSEPRLPTTMAGEDPVGTPCMLAVFGVLHGEPHVTVTALRFGATGDDEPGAVPGSSGEDPVGIPPDDTAPIHPTPVPEGCPTEPEYLFSSADRAARTSGPLVEFTPTRITVCTWEVTGEVTARAITAPTRIRELTRALNALPAPTRDLACTDEMGPQLALVVEDGDRIETVWVEMYGCGVARNGDRVRVGASPATLPGLVPGGTG